ncbi:hypothetical protein [Streptomyces sp. 1222.5]|uniref:hypothetical protein n=1 Tax=Streptomyces sp. 1222.5 TaxID=1881026 RepID=UPI003D750BBD
MSTDNILFLGYGAVLGVQAMNIVHARWAAQDARRSRTAAAAARRRAAGDRYLSSLRLYQLQHRVGVRR